MKNINPEMSPLYDKSVICLYCKHEFKTKKVRSRFVRPIKTDSDFCQYFESNEQNPILYFINVCPECGFSFSENTTPYFPPGTRELIHAQITSKWNKLNFCGERTINQGIQAYKLALLSSTLKKEKHIICAGICLRLAWLYRLTGDQEQEQRFLRLALSEYLDSYTEGDYEKANSSELNVLYLIGELNRRLGNYYEAIRFFSRVVNHPDRDFDPKYVKLAREQWQATKVQYEEEKREQMVIEEDSMIDM